MKIKAMSAVSLAVLLALTGCGDNTEEGANGGSGQQQSADGGNQPAEGNGGQGGEFGFNAVPKGDNVCSYQATEIGYEVGFPLADGWECKGGSAKDSLFISAKFPRDGMTTSFVIWFRDNEVEHNLHMDVAKGYRAEAEAAGREGGDVEPLNLGGIELPEGVWLDNGIALEYYWYGKTDGDLWVQMMALNLPYDDDDDAHLNDDLRTMLAEYGVEKL